MAEIGKPKRKIRIEPEKPKRTPAEPERVTPKKPVQPVKEPAHTVGYVERSA